MMIPCAFTRLIESTETKGNLFCPIGNIVMAGEDVRKRCVSVDGESSVICYAPDFRPCTKPKGGDIMTAVSDEVKLVDRSCSKGEIAHSYLCNLPKDEDEASEEILCAIEKMMEDIDPQISMENDGIGAYEYWGFKGYDHGHDYMLCEGNSAGRVTLEVDISNVDCDPMELAKEFIGHVDVTRTVGGCRCDFDYDEETGRYYGPRKCNCPPEEQVSVHSEVELKLFKQENKTWKDGKYERKTVYKVVMVLDLAWCNCEG
jgi:hypothetical protein